MRKVSNRVASILWPLICALAGSLISSATSASTQISYVTVAGMSVYSTAGVVVVISPAQPGTEGCSNQSGNQVWIDTTQPNGKSLHATVLAAYLAGHTVGFGVSGCDSSGEFPLVYRVDVGP